jgi:hypothetical protein
VRSPHHATARRLALPLLVAAAVARPAAGQDVERVTGTNSNAWFVYSGTHALSSKAGVHLEGQVRRSDFVADPLQLFTRVGVNYALADRVTVTGGYAYAWSSPYGEFPAPFAFPEHRVWQQLQLTHATGRLAWQHRYRLEQRWLGQMEERPGGGTRTDSWRYVNRFRYMARATLPLRGATVGPREPYVAASDEVFVGFGRQVQLNVFDQNRAYLGVGYQASGHTRVELGYLNQWVLRGNGREMENNHTVQLTLHSTAPLRKR